MWLLRNACLTTLLVVLALNTACRKREDSMIKADGELSDQKVMEALRIIGADIDGISDKRCAAACHINSWHNTISRELVTVDWARPTLKTSACFNAATSASQKISCFKDIDGNYDAKALGVYRAGAHLPFFQQMFAEAFSGSQGASEYQKFLKGDGTETSPQARMPYEHPNSPPALTEAEFKTLMEVYTNPQGIEKMSKAFGDVVIDNSLCETNITPELKNHIEQMEFEGWGAVNFSSGMKMYGCNYPAGHQYHPLKSPIQYCFKPQNGTGNPEEDSARWNEHFNVEWAKGWDKAKGTNGRFIKQSIRILSDFNGLRTTYWIRSSPDGRFVGAGKKGSAIPGVPNANGFIIDLKDNFTTGVDAPYDPGFFPDNSGFTFISPPSARFCSLKALLPQPGQTRRNFINLKQETKFCSDGGMGVYQHVAASIDGGGYLVVRGDDYENDDGGNSDFTDPSVVNFAKQDAKVEVYQMCQTSSCSEAIKARLQQEGKFHEDSFFGVSEATFINVPWEGDYGISPSGRVMTSRIGSMDKTRQIGYRLRTFDIANKTTKELGTFCVKGGKATLSFDESMMASHHYTDPTDWKEFNTALPPHERFTGPDDPRFIQHVEKDDQGHISHSSNIWLTNLRTGERFRITYMKPGQYALYPHFRSDGWLYFLVRDKVQNKHFVVATDAALRLRLEQGSLSPTTLDAGDQLESNKTKNKQTN
ncbi:MAG: hypothetical protein AB7T49_15150 [Oligoflexales bacterium]